MRLLRVFRLALINPRLLRQITIVETIRDGLTRRGNGAVIHLHTIGSHIGYGAILI